ncbi:MAG: GPR endopeptidase [Ruminococcaceae bacterium]|nr:GPR endopeptidase [Oscillospiraceae bacterium]
MPMRTDLAVEARELCTDAPGVVCQEEQRGDTHISRIRVENEQGERALQKPCGNYVTVEFSSLTGCSFFPDSRYDAVSQELLRLLPAEGMVLVAGLGNSSITPDALGPRTARQVLATRHITGELRRSAGMEGLRPAAVIAPGVLGQTGIEVLELLTALCGRLRPAAVVVVDAMASRRLSRLGCTVQISDAGISPGAGVGNDRPAINRKGLGVPVLSVGVPTVVEAATLARDLAGEDDAAERAVSPRGEQMIVTPKEIDLLIDRASRLLALSLNHALQPDFDPVELLSLC